MRVWTGIDANIEAIGVQENASIRLKYIYIYKCGVLLLLSFLYPELNGAN